MASSPDSSNYEGGFMPPSAHTLSLLSAKRPSLAGPVDSLSSFYLQKSTRSDEDFFRSQDTSSPAAAPDLSTALQIKMQGWVGEGVGKMSISPSGRDVVLAARSGLYVIDLETPLEVPRFIPQGGTWDVADVQWNPHPARANLVVSTSSEKLLIWNLYRPDRTAIQRIAPRHYRSITDVNWHNHNPDIVASTGIDSWIWMWDIRASTKPITGLCAFNPGATQVKWSRHNENILASSHGNILLIWDQRKGAVPLTTIRAHTARIYGIDWSRHNQNEIVTCSLDQSIKFWNTSLSSDGAGDAIPRPLTDAPTHTPHRQILTKYPVWRARHVPFGTGVLSLPQRGIHCPELFYHEDKKPVELISNQADIVTEYVWRTTGGMNASYDDRNFQLITWSEDRTIRAWPIDTTILETAGFVRGSTINDPSHRTSARYESYRAPPNVLDPAEFLTSISGLSQNRSTGVRPGPVVGARGNKYTMPLLTNRNTENTSSGPLRRKGTMTKGTGKFKRQAMHALEWIPSVTVGEKNSDSMASRTSIDPSFKFGGQEAGAGSFQAHNINDTFEYDAMSPWTEELTSVITGLNFSNKTGRLSLEVVDHPRRMCTIGLQGPWGENSSVFIRVTFSFPPDYPRSTIPPQIELDKNHLVPFETRTFLLRELRILARRPPCLEACLRLLAGLPIKRVSTGKPLDTDSGSSSEGEGVTSRKANKEMSATMRVETGLAEPRSSQGIFGPNGELVFFSHMPVRMMDAMGNITTVASASPCTRNQGNGESNRSSGGLSDALRRLTTAARDRDSTSPAVNNADEDLFRTLESLALCNNNEQGDVEPVFKTPQVIKPRSTSRIVIRDVSTITGIDQTVAEEYAVFASEPGSYCKHNAEIAQAFGRTDHERIFKTLQALLGDKRRNPTNKDSGIFHWQTDRLCSKIIYSFLQKLIDKKDVVMLALVSVALLASNRVYKTRLFSDTHNESTGTSPRPDYFSLIHRLPTSTRLQASSNSSPVSQLLQSRSPTAPETSLSPSASRSSWSSIANGVRFLVGGQDGALTPKPHNSPIERSRTLPVVTEGPPRVEGFSAGPKTPESTEKVYSPPFPSTQRAIGSLKSWSEPIAPLSHAPSRITISFSSVGHQQGQLEANTPWPRSVKKSPNVIFVIEPEEHETFDDIQLESQLSTYVLAFAECLFRWGQLHKRADLLRCLPKHMVASAREPASSPNDIICS
ncbi:hypothetical protein BU17DRAFT_80840 [Hysterangium stoloniferum]|nr:hypothetical protein BU17DRAFT_80840 [Hysterangium stoloniferum]